MPDLSAPASNRCWVAWSLFTAAGRFDQNACMTAPITHLWRLLKWGRILARPGALTGIEKDPLKPLPVRLQASLARFGARVPTQTRYAAAFQAIGPAPLETNDSAPV